MSKLIHVYGVTDYISADVYKEGFGHLLKLASTGGEKQKFKKRVKTSAKSFGQREVVNAVFSWGAKQTEKRREYEVQSDDGEAALLRDPSQSLMGRVANHIPDWPIRIAQNRDKGRYVLMGLWEKNRISTGQREELVNSLVLSLNRDPGDDKDLIRVDKVGKDKWKLFDKESRKVIKVMAEGHVHILMNMICGLEPWHRLS